MLLSSCSFSALYKKPWDGLEEIGAGYRMEVLCREQVWREWIKSTMSVDEAAGGTKRARRERTPVSGHLGKVNLRHPFHCLCTYLRTSSMWGERLGKCRTHTFLPLDTKYLWHGSTSRFLWHRQIEFDACTRLNPGPLHRVADIGGRAAAVARRE